MANFNTAFDLMIAHEGGYVNDPNFDSGGETYKGVSRKNWPLWLGWHIIDLLKKQLGFPANLEANQELQSEVESFYEVNFWNQIKGGLISDQGVANSIMDFGVNAGVGTSVKLAQKVVQTTQDGKVGNETIHAINGIFPEHFLAAFAVAKIRRYVEICQKRPENRKYFFGWVTRAIK